MSPEVCPVIEATFLVLDAKAKAGQGSMNQMYLSDTFKKLEKQCVT